VVNSEKKIASQLKDPWLDPQPGPKKLVRLSAKILIYFEVLNTLVDPTKILKMTIMLNNGDITYN
jgi:hypothetical protein